MARITYDARTAAAFKAVREIPRTGLTHWRDAVQRHLAPTPDMTVVDIGAGTGAFATALHDWFGVTVLAVEPSAAMRARIPTGPGVQPLEGDATALPLPDNSADGAWLSLVIHHVPDLDAAAREIRRVLRPNAPVLLRQGFAGRVKTTHTFPWEFFPEVTEMVTSSYPSVEEVTKSFTKAGFHREALEEVPENATTLEGFLAELDTFRHADTNMRGLTEDQFEQGKNRLRQAVETKAPPRTNWLDLLVLR